VTEWEFVARGTGFAAGDLFGLAGGTEDAFGKIVVVDAGRVVALEWLGLGTGYRPGEVATYSSPGVGLILLITEVA
jgi:hypothetical protein